MSDPRSTASVGVGSGGRVYVQGPYNPAWPGVARGLGGRWEADPSGIGRGAWTFPADAWARVLAAATRVYGEHGVIPTPPRTI